MEVRDYFHPEIACQKLCVPDEVTKEALLIKEKVAGDQRLVGKKPSVVSAAIVYFAAMKADHPLRKQHITDATGVGEASIRKTLKKLSEVLDEQIPKKYIFTRRNGDEVINMFSPGCRE